MRRKIKNRKMNNKGFSLIEVIIAMSILVIVSVPMLETLSGTTTVTRKASERQRATFLAQSISEGVKRYSTLDLCKAFVDQSVGPKNFPILNYIEDSVEFKGYGRIKKSGTSWIEDNSEKAIQENAKLYNFQIYGIETGLDKYDALITLDPSVYEDINAEVIPEIVNIGAPGSAFIDISGLYNGEDILKNVREFVLDDSQSPRVTNYNPNNLQCRLEVRIMKNQKVVDGNLRTVYEVYGNVTYTYHVSVSQKKIYTKDFLGARSFDDKLKLNYVYVLLSDKNLGGAYQHALNFVIDIDDKNENIPIAIVTGDNKDCKWNMTVSDGLSGGGGTTGTSKWRESVMFFTNELDKNRINMRSDIKMQDFATSGNKLKRIYDLKVELFRHNTNLANRFKGEPIDVITSSYLRIDVDHFNEEASKAED